MSPLPDDDRRELLILDTGPIREILLYYAVFDFGFENLHRELRWLPTEDSYDSCSEFIASFRRKLTSASVVSELDYWIRKTEEQGQADLWHRAFEEFRDMDLHEEAVRLVDMDVFIVKRFGPVDASLIALARRHQTDNPIILTVDQKLCGHCRKAGFGVRLLNEL